MRNKVDLPATLGDRFEEFKTLVGPNPDDPIAKRKKLAEVFDKDPKTIDKYLNWLKENQ